MRSTPPKKSLRKSQSPRSTNSASDSLSDVPYAGEESPTKARNRKVTLLETLVHTHAAIFDHVGEARATDLIEIIKAYADWDEGQRRLFLALARAISGEKPFP